MIVIEPKMQVSLGDNQKDREYGHQDDCIGDQEIPVLSEKVCKHDVQE